MEWRIRQTSGVEDQTDKWKGGSGRLVERRIRQTMERRIRQTSGKEDQTD